MRAINRTLHKVPFYRLTSTLSGVLLSHTETPNGQPIVRANTPPPPDVSERETQPWLEALPATMARYHHQKHTVMTLIKEWIHTHE